MRARVKPGYAASHDFHMQIAVLKVPVVDIRDFKLAAGRRPDGGGYVSHLVVVEIQPCDGIV